MLSGGEIISALLNLGIAVYLIRFYPRGVQHQFQHRPLPPLFGLLAKWVPRAGYLLAAGTLLYLLLRLSSTPAS